MLGDFLLQLMPPHVANKVIAMRANASIWEEAKQTGESYWITKYDMKVCRDLLDKNWNDFTDKDIKMVDMLALKYSDKPSEEDLSPDRVIN